MTEIKDYSSLLKKFDELDARKKMQELRLLHKKEEKLQLLELKIEKSGILEDWDQLKSICKKLDLRLYPQTGYDEPYEFNTFLMKNHSECKFSDNGNFIDYGFDGEYFGFKNEGSKIIWFYNFKFTKYTREKEVETKINLLELFLKTYEEYKTVQLERINNKLQYIETKINDMECNNE